jgi:hypothetical protein
MITLKDLTLLINRLNEAQRIFDAEATIEERKHKHAEHPITHDKRSSQPRSFVLHHKADIVHAIEQKILTDCEKATVSLDENTIYTARELIAESVYPWISRREPPESHIDDLLEDETFTPYAKGLEEKKHKLLESSLHILLLPPELQFEFATHFELQKKELGHDVTISIGDVISFGVQNLSSLFDGEYAYKTKLILFRLYVLGLINRKEVAQALE